MSEPNDIREHLEAFERRSNERQEIWELDAQTMSRVFGEESTTAQRYRQAGADLKAADDELIAWMRDYVEQEP